MPSTLQSKMTVDRHIQMWNYSVSHAALLLMSPKRSETDKRQLFYIKGVDHLNIDTSFECQSIDVALQHPVSTFYFQSPKTRFRIDAHSLSFAEDDEEYFAPITHWELPKLWSGQ